MRWYRSSRRYSRRAGSVCRPPLLHPRHAPPHRPLRTRRVARRRRRSSRDDVSKNDLVSQPLRCNRRLCRGRARRERRRHARVVRREVRLGMGARGTNETKCARLVRAEPLDERKAESVETSARARAGGGGFGMPWNDVRGTPRKLPSNKCHGGLATRRELQPRRRLPRARDLYGRHHRRQRDARQRAVRVRRRRLVRFGRILEPRAPRRFVAVVAPQKSPTSGGDRTSTSLPPSSSSLAVSGNMARAAARTE